MPNKKRCCCRRAKPQLQIGEGAFRNSLITAALPVITGTIQNLANSFLGGKLRKKTTKRGAGLRLAGARR
tara:strand:- start:3943 stop:4152 length:210 start_codon:yes stop_codon:yes gene_type:complete